MGISGSSGRVQLRRAVTEPSSPGVTLVMRRLPGLGGAAGSEEVATTSVNSLQDLTYADIWTVYPTYIILKTEETWTPLNTQGVPLLGG